MVLAECMRPENASKATSWSADVSAGESLSKMESADNVPALVRKLQRPDQLHIADLNPLLQ